MTALRDLLLNRVEATGPMTLAEYMSECLLHPMHGYYTSGDVFGAAGDFTTAPEISQMFGELIGLALAQHWMDQGKPDRAVLAELGPGRGTLMADALRATHAVRGFPHDVHLVEASARLAGRQRETLKAHSVTWATGLDELPDGPLFLVANEFFDALPIRQLVRDGAGWRERLITQANGELRFALGEVLPIPALAHRLGDTNDGDIVEYCPALSTWVTEIATRIARHGGLALIIDYGDWRSLGDTFQALSNHLAVDPLDTPGKADLTAHVDFEAIARSAEAAGAAVTAMTPQGQVLERLGITARARHLAASIADEEALRSHIAAHRRLTHPEEMGSLFKAIAIYRPGSPIPPGFDP